MKNYFVKYINDYLISDKTFNIYNTKIQQDNYINMWVKKAFEKESPLYKFLESDLFERLISHFEYTEEYEKCAYILKLSQNVKDKIS